MSDKLDLDALEKLLVDCNPRGYRPGMMWHTHELDYALVEAAPALIARARMAGRLLAALRMAVDFPESRATRAAAGAASVAARAAGIEPEP